MPLKLTKSKRKVKKSTKKNLNKKSKRKSNPYRHVTKADLIKAYEELLETGKYYYGQFEDLRIEYVNVRDRLNYLQENNRELASRNAALLHENELCRSQLTKITKDHLIKISGAEKEYDVFKIKLAKEIDKFNSSINRIISNNDPFFVLKQDFEKSLSVGDITHLDSIATVRNSRLSRCIADDQRHQERVKEKINNLFLERIDLTAMVEEESPISSAQKNGSTFSISSHKILDEASSSSHLNFTTLLDPPTNSTMIETPSFRRIVPKSPRLNQTGPETNESPAAEEDSGWEYNSEFIKVTPSEPVLSTSLDSIQNFIPKTPLLTQPVATHTPNRDSTVLSDNSIRKSYFNRLSVAFPEKTPNRSPITSFGTRGRTSRRLMNSATTSRECSEKYLTIETSTPTAASITTTSTSTSSTRPSTRISNRTSTRTFNETKTETQNDDFDEKNSNGTRNDSETESNDSETYGVRRSKRKRKQVCYRDK